MSVSIDGAGSLIGVDQGLNIVGLTTLTGGIILDDSISHIGDADTKIRFPAADTFTVETAGSERLRITSTGNIIPGTNNSTSIGDGTTNFASIWASTRFRGNDNVRLVLGDAQDLVIRHDGTNNIIGSPVGGDLHIKSGTLDNDNQLIAAFKHSNASVGIGTDNPTSDLHVFKSTSTSSIIDAAAGDALLTLRNAGNTNWSGINFTRERSTGTNVTGGSIWMPSDTANNSATLYLQTQSASANAGESGALTDNNGVRLKLASQPGGSGPNSAFSVEVGSTEKFRINSSGNVGIGTDNPPWPLSVAGTVSGGTVSSGAGVFIGIQDNYAVMQMNTASDANGCLIDMGYSGQDYKGRILYDNGSDYLSLSTNGGGELRIDASGRVTKPSQPSFHATNTTIGQINTDSYGTIVFNDVTNNGNHNIGGHYNTSNGRFTAPVSGRYLICARSLTNSTANSNPYVVIMIRINGNYIGYLGHNHTDSWIMESYTGILNLSTNDYVDVYVEQASAHGYQNYSSFSGHLLS